MLPFNYDIDKLPEDPDDLPAIPQREWEDYLTAMDYLERGKEHNVFSYRQLKDIKERLEEKYGYTTLQVRYVENVKDYVEQKIEEMDHSPEDKVQLLKQIVEEFGYQIVKKKV